MEGEKEKAADSVPADAPAESAFAPAPADAAMQQALMRLLRKRLKRFVALAPQVRADADATIIHDARVWSRRLQQAIDALFPKPRSAKVRRLRRAPRRIRRALGEWRNCDVLLEIVGHQHRRTRSEAKRHAWEFVRDYLLQKRAKEVARAVKKLLGEDLGDYAARAERVMRQAADESPDILMQRLGASAQEAWLTWQSALVRARETRAVADLHAFRIATKILRYRTELLRDVGAKGLKAPLKSLAKLQDAIGAWHDRQVLHRAVAEALARAEVLLNEMPAVQILLAELQKDRSRQADEVEKIIHLAEDHASFQQAESLSETDSSAAPSDVSESAVDKS